MKRLLSRFRPQHAGRAAGRRVRLSLAMWLATASFALGGAPLSASAAPTNIAASPVTDVTVTVYRNARGAGTLDLDDLGGYAFITETRTVSIPAGESRIRFEGVADGIDPASALITGLPAGLIEKNHDAKVLSPSALVAATVGHPVTWLRTNPKTGQVTEVPGTLLADADGVVFQANSGGIEALRCSGLPETFAFEPTTETNATPTLSAWVRASKPAQAQVRLSYLARGFDWMAHYSAVVAPDGKTMSLGAWVTLANSNSVSFTDARAKVVAGRVNREEGEPPPIDFGHEILARCWPRGSTSDPVLIQRMSLALEDRMFKRALPTAAPMADVQEIVVTGAKAQTVKEERLGDLKLYSVPDRTSVVSRQVKQVRLLDRSDIPIEVFYRGVVDIDAAPDDITLTKLLRTQNTGANHLGLALPSGHVSTFAIQGDTPLLLYEAPFSDTALNEKVELELGESADVHLSTNLQSIDDDSDDPHEQGELKSLAPVPGVRHPHSLRLSREGRIEVSNARPVPVNVEARLRLPDGAQVVRADPVPKPQDGLPTFTVTVPANGHTTIRFQLGAPPDTSE